MNHRPLTVLALLFVANLCAAAAPVDLQEVAARLADSPRLKVQEVTALDGATPAVKVIVTFDFIDPAGRPQTGRGKLLIPRSLLEDAARSAPLAYGAGYETPDAGAARFLRDGWLVATPVTMELNPMSRLPNLDSAFLKSVRALGLVDDAKVVISGGSAGGYTTLMLCAETFPVCAALPAVPPINWGYNVKYFRENQECSKPAEGQPPTSAPVPGVAIVGGMILAQHTTYYPADLEDRAWFLNSPISHLDTITNPLLVTFSTADVLVPIHQVGRNLIRPHDPSLFPAGFEVVPEKLMTRSEGRLTLLDRLEEDRYTLTIVPADPDWPDLVAGGRSRRQLREAAEGQTPKIQAPFKGEKQWEIVVIDEGPIVPQAGHFRYVFQVDTDAYLASRLDQGISPDQLTARKLQRLMKRYAGQEWLDTGLHRLDDPAYERADVLRGLVTFTAQGEAHARRFSELYRALPAELQVLGPAAQFANPSQAQAALKRLRG